MVVRNCGENGCVVVRSNEDAKRGRPFDSELRTSAVFRFTHREIIVVSEVIHLFVYLPDFWNFLLRTTFSIYILLLQALPIVVHYTQRQYLSSNQH